jgi:uncharacterized membrane protein YeaQ/YmgE (transglycosylase-associated protein family)
MGEISWFLEGLIGLAAGLAAERLLGRRFSIFAKLVAGVVGALLVAMLAEWLDFHLAPGLLTVFIFSLLGATLLLGVASLFRAPR